MAKDINEMIASAERELKMRKKVYPKWVELQKMSPQKADDEIAAMASILHTLTQLKGILAYKNGILKKDGIDALLKSIKPAAEQQSLFDE